VIFLKFYQQKITFLFFFTTDFENALLKKGAFRLNILYNNTLSGIVAFIRIGGNVGCLIALDPPQPPLKRGAFRLNMLYNNTAAHCLVFSVRLTYSQSA
jgi:hypothetical protein